MADPKQKSQSLPTFLTRALPLWQTPQWMAAERWRQTVYNLPVAMDCRDVLINELIASDWEIRSRDPKEEDALANDIDGYTEALDQAGVNGIKGFDPWCEAMGQDLLTIPVGGNSEVVRYQNGDHPFSRDNPKGHVFKIVYMDGATVYPTFDMQFPLAQRIKQSASRIIFFAPNETMRAVGTVRPELERWGYGMAPPEKVYLAINMLYRGDTYYANLLLDTPEAGLLDLGDMTKDSAEEWVRSFRNLFTGIDPMKIGVLYEHTKPANYLNFGRPPTEMMFDSTWLRYAQVTTSGYGLTLTDVGLGEPGKTLAGSIRDERRSRRSGFAVVREKIGTMINSEIVPPYLEFVWITKDEESHVQKARAFLLAAQGLKAAKEAGFLTAQEGQAQLLKDGHLTVEVSSPKELLALPAPAIPANGQTRQELERVPAGAGGRGDITGKAEVVKAVELGDERIASVPPGSDKFDFMAGILTQAFDDIQRKATPDALLPLIEEATRLLFPSAQQALIELSELEVPTWQQERLKLWFNEYSEFDDLPDVQKGRREIMAQLDDLTARDDWWKMPGGTDQAFELVMRLAFEEGATGAAGMAQSVLYGAGKVASPDLIGLNFDLKNPATLAQLERQAAQLVTNVDNGTRHFVNRIIVAGADEGLSSPAIARAIRDGANVEQILRDAGYTDSVIRTVQQEIGTMSQARANSIANTEIARAETEGQVAQWRAMGLKKKGGSTPVKPAQTIPAGSVEAT